MKRALITGITGQDGSYLAELLLAKGYEVHGIVRRVAIENSKRRTERLAGFRDKIIFHSATLENYASLFSVVADVKPDECYHLAAQSFVYESFEDAYSTMDTNINGTLFILSAIKKLVPSCKFYFAASSEMFGKVVKSPQNEDTPFYPRSPYGISKVAGFDLVRNYREAYSLYACSGILYNHESPRRGMEFVTRKITNTAARIKLGLDTELRLGNLDAKRDWGFSLDYCFAMFLMLQQNNPDDYVIATNETHTVREFVEAAFGYLDLDYEKYVVIDEKFYRPADVEVLQGDYNKANKMLGWNPGIKFKELVEMMVKADYAKEKLNI
jgi:GDPmannose 4,6-dehydratase